MPQREIYELTSGLVVASAGVAVMRLRSDLPRLRIQT